MPDNITENNLEILAAKLNISIKHGWKKALRKKLNKENPSIISDWISKGVPENFLNILKAANIDPQIWSDIVAERIASAAYRVPTLTPQHVSETPAADLHSDVASVISDVSAIMYSGETEIADALKKNVREFKLAVETKKRLHVCEDELKVVHKEINELKVQVARLTAPPTSAEGSDAS